MESENTDKYSYLAKNLLKGLVWLIIIIVLFLLVKNYFEDWYTAMMESIADKPIFVFSTFSLSEILFGIFPPELFMIWALHQGSLTMYITYTAVLGTISFAAGMIGYHIGHRFSRTPLYERFRNRKYGADLEKNVKKYGGFMVFIAAMTPVPFSAICMITGASGYHFYNFILISTSRILRFVLYAYAIWGVNQI